MAEHSTTDPQVNGSNPAPAKGQKKIVEKKSFENYNPVSDQKVSAITKNINIFNFTKTDLT